MKRVGRSVTEDNRYPLHTYKSVIYDKDGWADASFYLPVEYDLVELKIDGKKDSKGWSTGSGWDGFTVNPDDKVLSWRILKD